MFETFLKRPGALKRNGQGPFAEERKRYLAYLVHTLLDTPLLRIGYALALISIRLARGLVTYRWTLRISMPK